MIVGESALVLADIPLSSKKVLRNNLSIARIAGRWPRRIQHPKIAVWSTKISSSEINIVRLSSGQSKVLQLLFQTI